MYIYIALQQELKILLEVFLIPTGMSYIAGMFLMNMNEEVGSSACVLMDNYFFIQFIVRLLLPFATNWFNKNHIIKYNYSLVGFLLVLGIDV